LPSLPLIHEDRIPGRDPTLHGSERRHAGVIRTLIVLIILLLINLTESSIGPAPHPAPDDPRAAVSPNSAPDDLRAAVSPNSAPDDARSSVSSESTPDDPLSTFSLHPG